jgi:folate-binding protein YgfZ
MGAMLPAAEFTDQYAALTAGAGYAELPGRTLLEIRGSDRVAFLHAFCTNNIKALATGQGCEAFITSPQGKTLGHVLVLVDADCLLLETSPGQAAPLVAHFDRYVISEDVQFIDRTGEWRELVVAGGGAVSLVEGLASAALPAVFPSLIHAHIAARPVAICRVPLLGSTSLAIIGAKPDMQAVAALVANSAVRCDAPALEAARIEAGFPLFGSDITADNLPQEIGRDAQAISFTKGCYLGQETVARIDALGHVNRKLVGLRFAGEAIPPPRSPLLAAEKEVGHVTSSAWSGAFNDPLALAYVRTAHARPGSQLASPVGPTTVVTLPPSAPSA